MKIVIVGPGAMGCLFAAFLSKPPLKEDVWILDHNQERAARINQAGITLEGVSGKWQVKAKASHQIDDIGKADLLIICVKAYDTKIALEQAKALIAEDTAVLTLQNGLGNLEVIAECVGAKQIIAGVTNLGATLLDIGSARHAGKGETVIGSLDGRTTVQMRAIRELFNCAGLETRISRDIKSLLWSKLVINVGINALTAITRVHNGRLTEFEGSRRIMRQALTEAIRIAKRKRIKLIYDDPLAKVEAVCEATAGNVSSMLQDILRKKRTEIDFINGVIVRLGQELGIPVTVNALLIDLVKTIEASYSLRIDK